MTVWSRDPREVITAALTNCPYCDEEGDADEEWQHAELIMGALAGAGFMVTERGAAVVSPENAPSEVTLSQEEDDE